MGALRARVLGPVGLEGPDGEIRLGDRARMVVALLAAHRERFLSLDAIVEGVWGDDPPNEPGGAVHTLISRLRSLAGSELIATGPEGYRLGLPAEAVDAACFESLLAEAASAPPERALQLLDEALAL